MKKPSTTRPTDALAPPADVRRIDTEPDARDLAHRVLTPGRRRWPVVVLTIPAGQQEPFGDPHEVKDAVGDMAAASRLRRDTAGAMEQYSGDDKNLLPLLAVGGVGVVSVLSHLVGPALQELVRAFEAGDVGRALDLHLRHLALFEGAFATASPILLKSALTQLGLPAGPLRPPLIDATQEQAAFMRGLLADAGLLPGGASA